MANENELKKRDFRKELAEQILQLMEKGVAPWQKPWNPAEPGCLQDIPQNAVTGKPYRGGNAFWLMINGSLKGYEDPRWCTYKQAQNEGWQVRKGEKANTVEYWQFEEEKKQKNPETGVTETKKVIFEKPRIFYARVFNAKQIEGIPPYEAIKKESKPQWKAIENVEHILKNSGAKIVNNQPDAAFYHISRDTIHLPPKSSFPSAMEYYATALHELAHWTGHKDRLKRDLSGSFHSKTRAKEELRAEMASLYLAVELGIPFNPERHAAYNSSWIELLQEDKHEFFRATKDAVNITDYLMDLSRKKEVSQENNKSEINATVVEAIANKVVQENIKNPQLAQQIMEKIQMGLEQSSKENKAPDILIYNKNLNIKPSAQRQEKKENKMPKMDRLC